MWSLNPHIRGCHIHISPCPELTIILVSPRSQHNSSTRIPKPPQRTYPYKHPIKIVNKTKYNLKYLIKSKFVIKSFCNSNFHCISVYKALLPYRTVTYVTVKNFISFFKFFSLHFLPKPSYLFLLRFLNL